MTGLGKKPASFKDMTGMRFTRLVVISKGPSDSNGNARWHCQCDCGNTTLSHGFNLRNGASKSCGCLMIEMLKEGGTHRMTGSPEYHSWASMIQRCTNPRNTRFAHYGGRGISVCERWLDFSNFYADMGPRPSKGHTIERINNDGNYDPANCRWATKQEQNHNTSRNRFVTYRGRKLSVTQATKLSTSGISRGGVFSRLRSGWSAKDALDTPVNPNISKQSKKRRGPRATNGYRMVNGTLVEVVPRASVVMRLPVVFYRALKLAALEEAQPMRSIVESVMTNWLRERGYLK